VPLCQNVRFPLRKHSPGCQRSVFSKPHECRACAADGHLGTPLGTLFGCKVSRCASTVTVQRLTGNFAPTVWPKTRQGPQKFTQWPPKALFSEPAASLLPAVARKSALCENMNIYFGLHTFYGSVPLLFRTHNRLGNAVCTRSCLFQSSMTTSGATVTPKVAPRQAQGIPKGPPGPQKPSPGHLKTIKKSTCDPTWAPKGAREAPGVPPGRKMTPKSIKKRYFSTAPRA
jgi:hypothetical protein